MGFEVKGNGGQMTVGKGFWIHFSPANLSSVMRVSPDGFDLNNL
jgi:hypothetical protein